MEKSDIARAVTPLRLIFWGGLLCVLDFSFSWTRNGEGFRLDILNDFVGMLLITFGVFQLANFNLHERYARAMTFVKVIAIISTIEALREHFIFRLPMPEFVSLLFSFLGLCEITAVICFCIAMQWLCREAKLTEAEQSWRVTTILCVIIYAVPLGLLYLSSFYTTITGQSFHLNLGPAGLLLMVVFIVPLIHLFISTSRMKSAAERASVQDWHPADGDGNEYNEPY